MIPQSQEKRCSLCKETKPRAEFNARRERGPNALQGWCKKCQSAKNKKYSARRRAARVQIGSPRARWEVDPVTGRKRVVLKPDNEVESTVLWRRRHPEKAKESRRREYLRIKANPIRVETSRRKANDYNFALRVDTITAYGGNCACCGESHLAFLAVDHINGGGNEHRRQIMGSTKGGVNFYRWLRNMNFPAGYRVLCHNCNFAMANGGCPHQRIAG